MTISCAGMAPNTSYLELIYQVKHKCQLLIKFKLLATEFTNKLLCISGFWCRNFKADNCLLSNYV